MPYPRHVVPIFFKNCCTPIFVPMLYPYFSKIVVLLYPYPCPCQCNLALHTTARKTTLSLLATFTLIFNQTWVNYKGIMFFLSCSKIGVVYLIYLLGQGQWISIFPIMLHFIHIAPNLITITNYYNNVKLYTSFHFILEALHEYIIVLTQSSIGCDDIPKMFIVHTEILPTIMANGSEGRELLAIALYYKILGHDSYF